MMHEKKRGGKPRRPGGRQVPFWSDDKTVRLIDRAVKKAGQVQGINLSRSKWLEAMASRAAREELATK